MRRWLETTIRGEFSSRPGSKRFKNALPHSTWAASCGHALSKTYLERKRTAGEGQNAKAMSPARRRLNVLFAKFKHGVFC